MNLLKSAKPVIAAVTFSLAIVALFTVGRADAAAAPESSHDAGHPSSGHDGGHIGSGHDGGH